MDIFLVRHGAASATWEEHPDPGLSSRGLEEAQNLLMELYVYQTQEQFLYRHKWQANMLVMWDNRALLHAATGGYDGHDRLLHRITIADSAW